MNTKTLKEPRDLAFATKFDQMEFRKEYDKYGPTEASYTVWCAAWQAALAAQGDAVPESDALTELNHTQYLMLENCRLLAARHRKEEWAQHILRFCDEANVRAVHIRHCPSPAPVTGQPRCCEHDSDCAVHNAPALPVGPCDCSLSEPVTGEKVASDKITFDNPSYPAWLASHNTAQVTVSKPAHAGAMAEVPSAWLITHLEGTSCSTSEKHAKSYAEFCHGDVEPLFKKSAIAQRKPAGSIDALAKWASEVDPATSDWASGYEAARSWVKVQIDAHSGKVSAGLLAESGEVLRCATELAKAIWRDNYKTTAPNWEPLTDLMGVLSQIDNMVCGMARKPAYPQGAAGLTDALNKIDAKLSKAQGCVHEHHADKFITEARAIIATLKGEPQ